MNRHVKYPWEKHPVRNLVKGPKVLKLFRLPGYEIEIVCLKNVGYT